MISPFGLCMICIPLYIDILSPYFINLSLHKYISTPSVNNSPSHCAFKCVLHGIISILLNTAPFLSPLQACYVWLQPLRYDLIILAVPCWLFCKSPTNTFCLNPKYYHSIQDISIQIEKFIIQIWDIYHSDLTHHSLQTVRLWYLIIVCFAWQECIKCHWAAQNGKYGDYEIGTRE